MDWLKEIIKKYPFAALIMPTGLGGFSFLGNLIAALGDGRIDSNELHQLLSSADALQTILLIIIMYALKEQEKRNR